MIEVQNLTKSFGPKLAVNDVSFRVERGQVLGFLGPNGAGKSTTMRMVTGFIPPTFIQPEPVHIRATCRACFASTLDVNNRPIDKVHTEGLGRLPSITLSMTL